MYVDLEDGNEVAVTASLKDFGLPGVLLRHVADILMVETAGEGEDESFDEALVPNISPMYAPIPAKTTTFALMRNHHKRESGNSSALVHYRFMWLCILMQHDFLPRRDSCMALAMAGPIGA